jgi:D-glycerate 3-kinase
MPGLMDQTALARFMAHYERLTRHALATLPARADLTSLDRQRNLTG